MSAYPTAVPSMLDAALDCARGGWRIFPVHYPMAWGCSCRSAQCQHAAKHPRIDDWPNAATRDEVTIRDWWGRWPLANIGLPTGAANGVIVLDLDGSPVVCHMMLAGAGITLPTTRVSRTGGGGRHYFFRTPGRVVPNRTRLLVASGNGDGRKPEQIDIRGDGGYVLLAPSLHASGERYRWIETSPNPTVAPLPKTLLDLIMNGASRREGERSDRRPDPEWVIPALTNGVDEGQRNDMATRLAGHFLSKFRCNEREVFVILTPFAERCRPPMNPEELRRVIDSVAKTERRKVTAAPVEGPAAQTAAGSTVEHLTDLGNAKRIVARHGHNLRYVKTWGCWLVWDGARWRRDDTGGVVRRAKDTVTNIYGEAAGQQDEGLRKELARHATRSESEPRISAMITLAESEPGIAITPDQLDAHPWLLNCTNGALDLRTGTLRAHRREDLITKSVAAAYDVEATCPTFARFVDRIFAENGEVIGFVQKAIGYSLTGDTREQALFVNYGGGSNGKTTLLRTVTDLLDDYARWTPTETFLMRRGQTIPNDIAALKGARFVASVEAEGGRRLAETLVKQLTGGDKIAARYLYSEFFEFIPAFKLWIAVNHKPVIRETTHALWRRIRLIPFTVEIPDHEQDKELPDKLRAEFAGILAWAVQGCLRWQREGLGPPATVRQATQEYRTEMDTLGAFLEARCVVEPGAEGPASELYTAYVEWAKANGEHIDSQKVFGTRLTERGFTALKRGGARLRVGVRLRNLRETPGPSPRREADAGPWSL